LSADLIQIKARLLFVTQILNMWQHISTAPYDRDVELAVIDGEGPHALVFPCRRIAGGWMNALTQERMDVRPTHWREWTTEGQAAGSRFSREAR
jgi:hypothetical protein